jgi:hypothetical protein
MSSKSMVGTWSRHDRCDCAGSVSYCRQYEALADVAMWRRGYNMRLPDARLHHPAGPGTTTARSCAWWLPRPLVSAYSFRTSTTRGACHSIAGRRSHVRVVTCATCRKYGYVVVVSQQGAIDMSWSFVIWRGVRRAVEGRTVSSERSDRRFCSNHAQQSKSAVWLPARWDCAMWCVGWVVALTGRDGAGFHSPLRSHVFEKPRRIVSVEFLLTLSR